MATLQFPLPIRATSQDEEDAHERRELLRNGRDRAKSRSAQPCVNGVDGSILMPHLAASLQDYGTKDFETTLKRELAGLGPDILLLQHGLRSGSISHGSDLGAMILAVSETRTAIHVRAGIFFTSTLSGCACTDDPTPADQYPEYHEIELSIDRCTGKTEIHPAQPRRVP